MVEVECPQHHSRVYYVRTCSVLVCTDLWHSQVSYLQYGWLHRDSKDNLTASCIMRCFEKRSVVATLRNVPHRLMGLKT